MEAKGIFLYNYSYNLILLNYDALQFTPIRTTGVSLALNQLTFVPLAASKHCRFHFIYGI